MILILARDLSPVGPIGKADHTTNDYVALHNPLVCATTLIY
jgi:hypothetical protein